MYILKYDINNTIIWNGTVIAYDTFLKCNPHIKIEQGKFFELYKDKVLEIDSQGFGKWGDINKYRKLLNALKGVPFPSKNYGVDINISHYTEFEKLRLTEKAPNKIAIGFTVDKDYKQVWHYRDKTDEELEIERRQKILRKIQKLESSVTERRKREAILGIDKGWLKKRNTLIEKERAKL